MKHGFHFATYRLPLLHVSIVRRDFGSLIPFGLYSSSI